MQCSSGGVKSLTFGSNFGGAIAGDGSIVSLHTTTARSSDESDTKATQPQMPKGAGMPQATPGNPKQPANAQGMLCNSKGPMVA